MNNLRVSVIVPTYNRAAYLREALLSVFDQTLAPWEVVVVDDGSLDDTAEVIQKLGKPIHFFRQEHQGIAVARNLGLQLATGDLIAWLDSDDLWEPEFLATVVPVLGEGRADVVYTGITYIDADGKPLRTAIQIEPPEKLYEALVSDCFLATPSIVAWKACYEYVGSFDPQFCISEDYDMWLRLAKRYRMLGVPRCLVRIRVHATNTMSDLDTLVNARLALTRKHFGELAPASHPEPLVRTAYAYAFRSIAIACTEHGRTSDAWCYLKQAALLHPAILERLDTSYELALGSQRRGTRGDARQLDIRVRAAELLKGLDGLFVSSPELSCWKRIAYGNAYLALAMLSDQAGDWSRARRYLLEAVLHNPKLLSRSFFRRALKLTLGPALASWIRGVNRSRTLARQE